MKNILILLGICMTNISNAQNSDNIEGVYNLGSSSPESGSHLIVLANGRYGITYFGGVQLGKWHLIEGDVYEFTPINDSEFELYGRHSKNLGNRTRIFFNGFENGETLIGLNSEKEDELKMDRVFNTDANCFSFPYVYTFEAKSNKLSFLAIEDYSDAEITTFSNPEGYNDLIANFNESDEHADPFEVLFKEEKMYFSEEKYSARDPFEEDDEDMGFLLSIINKTDSKDEIYLNPAYNRLEGNINDSHVFNEQKGAFIDANHYVEGDEDVDSDNSYDNMSIIYRFEALNDYRQEEINYKINKKSLFQVSCD
jgi:hypothetical protein